MTKPRSGQRRTLNQPPLPRLCSYMTDIYWLEQTEADLPAVNDWLSESEAARLNSMRFEKRSKSWRLGRWTAKHAIVAYRNLPCDHPTLRQIEIRAAAS